MDEYVEIGNVVEGDDGTQIADLQNNQISSSEDEKLISSSEDEKSSRSSSEDGKCRDSSVDEKLISSSEDVKSRSSSEDVKSRSSSEEDEKRKSVEYEKRKRQNSDEEEYEGKKRQKLYRVVPQWIYDGVNHIHPPTIEDTYDPDSYAMSDDEEPVDEDENRDDDSSYFTREQVERKVVTPEEYEVELTDEEKRFYFDDDDGGVGFHWATKADMKALEQAIKESEGFDVPLLPGAHYHGTHRTNLSTAEDAIRVARYAKCALKFYNRKNGSDYKFVRLVMSATRPCAGLVFFITFKAMSPSTGYTEIFQTKAFYRFTGDVHIMMCRIKNEDYQPQLKDEQYNPVISTN